MEELIYIYTRGEKRIIRSLRLAGAGVKNINKVFPTTVVTHFQGLLSGVAEEKRKICVIAID